MAIKRLKIQIASCGELVKKDKMLVEARVTELHHAQVEHEILRISLASAVAHFEQPVQCAFRTNQATGVEFARFGL